MFGRSRSTLFAAALTPLLGACALVGGGSAAAPAPATAASASGFTDANIAAIVVAANNADILYADLALAKSRDADVLAFATMVKKDHQAVNEAAIALVTRLKVTPVDDQTSFDLRDDAETKRLHFRDLEGFAFDSTYAANEVSYHTTVLGAIEKVTPTASIQSPSIRL